MRKRSSCCRLVSVCLSVTFVHCIQTTKDIVKLGNRYGEGRVLGVIHAIVYCTNASRGLSALAEVLAIIAHQHAMHADERDIFMANPSVCPSVCQPFCPVRPVTVSCLNECAYHHFCDDLVGASC